MTTTTDLLNMPISELANIAASGFYSQLASAKIATEYFISELMLNGVDEITDIDSLENALGDDIRDLLHNGNIDDLLPEEVPMMGDLEEIALCDRILSDDYTNALAKIIFSRFTP